MQAYQKKTDLRTLAFIISFILFFFLFYTGSFAQTIELIDNERFTEDAKEAIDHLYNRNNQEAEAELYVWRTKHPSHPIWLLWDGMELWWEILEDLVDTSQDEAFINQMRKADYEASRLLHREPDHVDALIIKAVANSYVARMYANREDWLKSVQIGRQGYQAHQRLIQVAPDLPDNLFAEGIKLYYAAYIPETYTFLRAASWFMPDGDRDAGLETLKKASQKAVFARPEANYFLASISLNYEEDNESAKYYFKKLVDNYPSNGYYKRLYIRTLAHLNEYSEIISFFEETMKGRGHVNINSNSDPVTEADLWYWHGRAQFHFREYSNALSSLETSVEIGGQLTHKTKREIYTLASYYAGRTSEMMQDKDKARVYYSIAIKQDAAPNAKKRAQSRLNTF